MSFESFDPLKAKSLADTEVAALAQKREIMNILGSYVGWYDPFCELIQNSLDSLDIRASEQELSYEPKLWITVNLEENSLIVTDNGTGLNEREFKQFLCPDISFKSGKTRGHKGVGATYLAYGFNFIQVATRIGDFSAVGKMEGARRWLTDDNPSGNPQIVSDISGAKDCYFSSVDRGVSIYVKFDRLTQPGDLSWLVTDKAENWFKILTIKTGLGAFYPEHTIKVTVKVIDRQGEETIYSHQGIGYYLPHNVVQKAASINEINKKNEELFKKRGANFNPPAKYTSLDAIYEQYNGQDLLDLDENDTIRLTPSEKEIIAKHNPGIYVVFVYSLKIWDAINEDLRVRSGQQILYGGIQIAANNMPQGEMIQIPLFRNIGRQNQIHALIHFEECTPDLGRKGFQREIVEFAKEISRKIADGPLLKLRGHLRANTGKKQNLRRETQVDNWKREMELHENANPLEIINKNFFLPSNHISITSIPTREQDVIALFNQLLAGGVIRGIKVMSTNERLTYDGLIRVVVEPPSEHHLYDRVNNPLGIDAATIEEFDLPFKSAPRILEYKFSLDGLIEDIDNGNKNSNDISLVICWETGELYKKNYHISSLLDPDNLSIREYHGITHVMTNLNTNQKEIDLIVLEELIKYLNEPEIEIRNQIKKYEE
ncbi:MAG: ATP-binding protein [Caldilineaceae bacterium]|nr:ATP-binding protein [Caldilineaceae bacterium]